MPTLREEIDDILVDAYGEEEQRMAWEVAFTDGVRVPFSASLLGVPVQVEAFRLHESGAMQCQIAWDGNSRWIGVEDLDPKGLPKDLLHVLELRDAWLEGDY